MRSLIVCLLILQAVSIKLNAQTATTDSKFTPVFISPFSRYGLGEMNDRSFIRQRAMGDVSIAAMDENVFSLSNPASYSSLKSFVLETGINSKIYQIDAGDQSFKNKDFQLSYIALAIPIDTSWKWGFSLGLIPFSKIGYNVKTQSSSPVKSTEIFEGKGGYNSFYAGTSIQLFKNFYAGVNAAYLFGNDNFVQTIEFRDSADLRGLRRTNKNIVGGLKYDAGIIYQLKLANNSDLQFGLTANLPASINAKQELYSTTTVLLDGVYYTQDTLENINRDAEKVFIPAGVGGGIQFRKSDNFMIAADWYFREWSKLKYFDRAEVLNDYLSFGIGMEWSAKNGDIAMKGFKNYMKLIKFRTGFKYAQTYLASISGKPEEMHFTLGLGLPVGSKGSNIDLAIDLGQIGSSTTTEITERFIKLSLGFHLFDDSWFKRRKID